MFALSGIGPPSAACNLARLTHAPEITLIYESGTIGSKPRILPLSIGDGELATTAMATVSVPELFSYWLQGGRVTVGFLGAAQVDRYGNINTTVIGDYHRPDVRLPGGGGALEIAAGSGKVFVIVKHSLRTLVNELDFVTSLGFGTPQETRRQLGLTTAGPTLVVTDLCIMKPEPSTHELVVTSIHPGIDAGTITASTGWPLRFAEGVDATPPPTSEELAVLRELQRATDHAHKDR